MSKYNIIYSLDKNLYCEDSPVVVCSGALVLNSETGMLHIQIKLLNLAETVISSAKVGFVLTDSVGQKIGYNEKIYLNLNAAHGVCCADKDPSYLSDNTARGFSVIVHEVNFADGSRWTAPENAVFEAIPAPNLIGKILHSDRALNEFKNYCKAPKYEPFTYKDLWICSCGEINKISRKKCGKCGAAMSAMLNIDGETLQKDNIYREALQEMNSGNLQKVENGMSLFSNIIEWRDSRNKIEECKQLIAKIKENQEKYIQESNIRKKKILTISVSAACAVIALIICICSINAIAKSSKYNQAQNYIENCKYDEAINILKGLQGYKDADEMYKKACNLRDGNYKEVIKKDNLTEFVIPSGVTSICDNAFCQCTELTSITIPDSVTSIGYQAFCGCSGLTSVTIPDSVTSIGESAFSGCGLTSITIPNNIISIGDAAFSNCHGLIQVAWNAVNCIYKQRYNSLFENCNKLTKVTIGKNVELIPNGLFAGCKGLTSIMIPDNVFFIGSSAFYGCSGLTSIAIPDNIISLGGSAFYGCSGLTSVTIGNGVTSIGDQTFYKCSKLTKITMGNRVVSIGSSAFEGCSKLKSITIPDRVTSIGDSAFSDCSGLTSITIPNSITSIGSSAFYNCSGLISITIPDSVTSIGKSAFSGCSKLASITLPFVGDSRKTANDKYQYPFGYIFGTNSYTGGISTTQCYYGYSTSYTTYDTYYIPSSLKSVTITGGNILRGAFENCSKLTSITIGNGVASIGESTFYGCSGLTSITIPDSVTSIGGRAFEYCGRLTSITIPDSVTSIGDRAFYYCSGLKKVYYEGTSKQWNNISISRYYNDSLTSATRYYYSKTKPTTSGNFWHYDENGNIKEW